MLSEASWHLCATSAIKREGGIQILQVEGCKVTAPAQLYFGMAEISATVWFLKVFEILQRVLARAERQRQRRTFHALLG